MSTHTPGPWKVHPYRNGKIGPYNMAIDVGPAGRMVAQICGEFEKPVAGDEAEANARLIAAAPDLLTALKALVIATDGHPGSVRQRDEARAAIAKAEGTS